MGWSFRVHLDPDDAPSREAPILTIGEGQEPLRLEKVPGARITVGSRKEIMSLSYEGCFRLGRLPHL
jgi:hypothetical protein